MAEQLTVEEIIAKVAAHKDLRNFKSKREKNHRYNNQPQHWNTHSIQANKRSNHIKKQQSLKQNLPFSQSPTNKLIKKYEQLHHYYAKIKRSYTSKLHIKQKYQKIQSQLQKVLKQNKKLQQNLNTIRMKSISVFNASNYNLQQSQQNYTNRHFLSNNGSDINCSSCRAKYLNNTKTNKSRKYNNNRYQLSFYTQHLVRRQSMSKSHKKNDCCNEHNFSDVNSGGPRKSSPTKNNNMTEYSIKSQNRNKFNQDPECNQKPYENHSKHNIKRFDIAQYSQSQQYDKKTCQQTIKLQTLQAEVKLLIEKLQGFIPLISQESFLKNQLIQLTQTKKQNIKKYEQLIMQQENLIKQYSHINLSYKQQKNEQQNYISGTIVKIKRKKSNYQQMQQKSLKREGNNYKFGNKYYEQGASTKKKGENRVFGINSYRQHQNGNHKNPNIQRVKRQQYIFNTGRNKGHQQQFNRNKRQKYFYQNLRPSGSSSSSQINETSEFIAVE